jgi:hypothetical protein
VTPAPAAPRVIVPAPGGESVIPPAGNLAPVPLVSATAESDPVPATEPTKVASLSPEPKPAPFPTPVSQRPVPQVVVPAEDEPLFLDNSDEAIVIPEDVSEPESDGPVPPAGIDDDPIVSDPDSLRSYLEDRGFFDDDESTAEVDFYGPEEADDDYDPDGFYLSDGPNAEQPRRLTRRERIDLLFGADTGVQFNLF